VGGLTEFLDGKAMGSMVNIMLKPISRKTELEIKKLEMKGQRQISKMKSSEGIKIR
jgi:hypothetical protein